MRIAINTETRKVVTWAAEPLTSLAMTRGDKFPVEVKFISGPTYIALPLGAAGKISLKRAGDFAGDTVAAALWTASGEGRNAVYSFFLDLDTVELNDFFDQEQPSLDFALEIEWVHPVGTNTLRQSSLPVPVVVSNDYIRQGDITPVGAPDGKATQAEAEAGTDNVTWMTPLRTAQAIAKLNANGNFRSTFIGPTPPSPVVNGTIWVNSVTLRPHTLFEGVWAEISTD
jgi:hypothetical protein